MANNIIVDGKVFTEENIKEIGRRVASIWGAEFVEYEEDENNKSINFFCIEHGEAFVTTVKYTELNNY